MEDIQQAPQNIDQIISEAFQPIADFVSSVVFYAIPVTPDIEIKIILIWLAAAALFFTIYLGAINVRLFGHAISLLFSEEKQTKKTKGQISRFQALTTSLSGTVGLGNIAGVAAAISIGGPGAMLWMIIMGFLGMSTKFAEVMLAVFYRKNIDTEDGKNTFGGPMYYLKEAFVERNLPQIGTIVAAAFAFLCICGAVGGGNMFQANQAYQQAVNVSGGAESILAQNGWMFGVFLAILVGIVIIGGLKSIAAVASKLVPVMGGIYLLAGIVVIALHYQNIPSALLSVIESAFSMEAGIGGFMGGMLVGIQRAAFSNEAGLGSAAIVHANAKTDNAVSQGLVGMLGPFIDTIVICSVTALVIVVTGVYQQTDGLGGIELTSQAFAMGIPWFPYILALTAFLFAYSTIITWYYYGERGTHYLFGESKLVEIIFKMMFCGFIIIGASMNLKSLIDFSDAMILAMAFPNILGLFILAPKIKSELKKYKQAIKK